MSFIEEQKDSQFANINIAPNRSFQEAVKNRLNQSVIQDEQLESQRRSNFAAEIAALQNAQQRQRQVLGIEQEAFANIGQPGYVPNNFQLNPPQGLNLDPPPLQQQPVLQQQAPVAQQTYREKIMEAAFGAATTGPVISVPDLKKAITKQPTASQQQIQQANRNLAEYLSNPNNVDLYHNSVIKMYDALGFDVNKPKIADKITDKVARSVVTYTIKDGENKTGGAPSKKYYYDRLNVARAMRNSSKLNSILGFLAQAPDVLQAIQSMTGVASVGVNISNGAVQFQYQPGKKNFPISKLKKDVVKIKTLVGKSLKANGQDPRKNLGYQKLNLVVIPMLKAITCFNEMAHASSRFSSQYKNVANQQAFVEYQDRSLKSRAAGLPLRAARTLAFQQLQMGEIDANQLPARFLNLVGNLRLRDYVEQIAQNKNQMIPDRIQKIKERRENQIRKAPLTDQELQAKMVANLEVTRDTDLEAIQQYLSGPERAVTLFPKRKINEQEQRRNDALRQARLGNVTRFIRNIAGKNRRAIRGLRNRQYRPQADIDKSFAKYRGYIGRNMFQGDESKELGLDPRIYPNMVVQGGIQQGGFGNNSSFSTILQQLDDEDVI